MAVEPTSLRQRANRAALLLAAAAVMAGCDRKAPATPAEPPAVTEAPPPVVVPPPVLAPVQSLTRGDLVTAAAAAASAFAEGRQAPVPDPLLGRRFIARIPFGCTGPTPAAAPAATPATAPATTPRTAPAAPPAPGLAGWTRAPDGKTIQLTLEPADWAAEPPFADAEPAARWEAVEGFWIPRPWLAAETCPQVTVDPLQPSSAASPQSVALAAVFERGGSRVGRRDGRAYSFTVRGRGDELPQPPAAGYRLVLAGRIVGFPGGRAFACRASGADQRPVCVAAVVLDRVAFEVDDAVLSEWRPG